nr:thioredoxin family protein [Bacteroidales bacterium]
QLEELKVTKLAFLVYFSHEKCSVCKALKPKINLLLERKFPKMEMYYADTVVYPEIAAQNTIFTVPTIIAFFDGKESFRKSRNISMQELENILLRPYDLIFS